MVVQATRVTIPTWKAKMQRLSSKYFFRQMFICIIIWFSTEELTPACLLVLCAQLPVKLGNSILKHSPDGVSVFLGKWQAVLVFESGFIYAQVVSCTLTLSVE